MVKPNLDFSVLSLSFFSINITKRCDGVMDCSDNSDERKCHMINLDQEAYNKEVPPPPVEGETKLNLLANINIHNILELDEVMSLVSLQMDIQISWSDPRISFIHLKKNKDLNVLTLDEMSDIWMPTILFSDTKSKQEAHFKNRSSYVIVDINEGKVVNQK